MLSNASALSGHTHISITICRVAVVCSGLVAADDDRGWPGDSHSCQTRPQSIHTQTYTRGKYSGTHLDGFTGGIIFFTHLQIASEPARVLQEKLPIL